MKADRLGLRERRPSSGIDRPAPSHVATKSLRQYERLLHSPDGESRAAKTAMLLASLVCLSNPIVASWTLAVPPIHWLLPRCGSRRVGYQPGMLAARTASIVLTVFALLSGCMIAVSGGGAFSHDIAGAIIVILLPLFVAPVVIFTWMTLVHPAATPIGAGSIDSAAVGIYWIVAALLTIVAMATIGSVRAPQPVASSPVNLLAGTNPRFVFLVGVLPALLRGSGFAGKCPSPTSWTAASGSDMGAAAA